MKRFSKLSGLLLAVWLLSLASFGRVSADPGDAAERYDVTKEGIVSSYYSIDTQKGFITGIAPGTPENRLRNVCLPATTVVSQEVLATGTTISAPTDSDQAPSIPHMLTVIVTGDLNGDANVTITDMLMLKSQLLGGSLSDTASAAADVNYDGSITITDFLRIKSTLLGLDGISAGRPNGTSPQDPIILMTPGSSLHWTADADSSAIATFSSEDATIAAIEIDGTITAGTAEGSTFVYALDSQGLVLSRSIVTVLQDDLAVSLGTNYRRLQIGQTFKLSAACNHPVLPQITWTSSDDSVVSVSEDGTLTAHAFGSATVTAALDNGNTAEAQIAVAPPITSVDTGKDLYKIRPGNCRAVQLLADPADTGEEFIWTSSDPSVATVSQNGIVTGVTYGTATITVTGKYSGMSASCTAQICDVKQVAITFDDGPSYYTTRLLNFLRDNDIPATFFLVGERIPEYASVVKRQVEEGHEIGYHSYSHKTQTSLSSEQIILDFEKSSRLLKEASGGEFTLWRTPGGAYDQRVMDCIKLPHILWSVDTLDWQSLNSDAVYREIINNSYDGAIILLHDLYSSSVNGAMNAMLDMLSYGYEFVTVTELLSRDGTPPENSTNYFDD